jgi:hypothetical protein
LVHVLILCNQSKISYVFVGAALAAIIVDQAAPTILFCNPCSICPDESSLVDKKKPVIMMGFFIVLLQPVSFSF